MLDLFANIPGVFQEKKKKFPIIGEIYRGEELILVISECEGKISQGVKILSSFLPKYKFYTDLLEQLFESHRRQGIKIKQLISEIRPALIRDLQFEKKVLDEIFSGLMQFVVIAATTWSFVALSKSLVQIPLDGTTKSMMIFLEVMGAILFLKLLSFYKRKVFNPFYQSIEELYKLFSLFEIGLSINEAVERSGIMNGSLVAHKHFESLALRLKKLISRMKETGLSPKEEIQEVIREIWHLQDVSFQKFTKKVQILKFSILAFFFLPAYFLYLYSIFKFFMEQ